MRKTKAFAALALGLTLSLTACGKKAVEETEGGRSGVEYFADQMSQAMDEAANERAEEARQARNEGDGKTMTISNTDDLLEFAERVNGGEPAVDAVLEADLDLSAVCGLSAGSWTPIMKYNGTFEGNGHTISNLYVVGSGEDKVGLFGTADQDSVIQNLTMAEVQIDGGDYVGAVVGDTKGSVLNCHTSSGTIRGNGRATGGVVGCIYHVIEETEIRDCSNGAEVENNGGAKCIAGGVAGYNDGVNAANCTNEGTVGGNAATIGGVFGAAEGSDPIYLTDCENHGIVDGRAYVGGVFGNAEYCIMNRCKNTGSVTGYTYVGGLCGYFGGERKKNRRLVTLMENCSNEGDISLKYLGENEVFQFENSKTIYDTQQAAGLTGVAENAAIINSRNTGDILCNTGKDFFQCGAGYLAFGKKAGERNVVINCISTGTITPPEQNEDFENSMTAIGRPDGQGDCAQIFFAGETVIEKIAPTELSAFTDGTVLAAVNAFPDGVDEALLARITDAGLEYEACSWKAGADGVPVLEWE